MPINFAVYGEEFFVYSSREVPDERLRTGGVKYVHDVLKGRFFGITLKEKPSDMNDGGGKHESSTLILMAPSDAPISKLDQVLVDNVRYSPVGDESSWKVMFRGRIDHLEIPLRRTP